MGIAIQLKINKYVLNVSYGMFIREAIDDNCFDILPIEPKHTSALMTLPLHHRDPFDRLSIAQAIVEGIPIITADAEFDPVRSLDSGKK